MVGDVQLHSSSLLTVDTLGGTLTIKETQKVDAGDYTCVAVNAAGTSSGKISLDVGGESLVNLAKVQLRIMNRENNCIQEDHCL